MAAGGNKTGNGEFEDMNKIVQNINAKYEVPGGANPAILIQNTSFNRKIWIYS